MMEILLSIRNFFIGENIIDQHWDLGSFVFSCNVVFVCLHYKHKYLFENRNLLDRMERRVPNVRSQLFFGCFFFSWMEKLLTVYVELFKTIQPYPIVMKLRNHTLKWKELKLIFFKYFHAGYWIANLMVKKHIFNSKIHYDSKSVCTTATTFIVRNWK